MARNSLKNLGKLESFEIRNTSKILLFIAPSIFIYLDMISASNKDLIIPYNGNLIFSVLFLIVGIISYFKKKIIIENYGWLVFLSALVFQHYLTYTTNLNGFSLDCLLAAYIFMFGALLLLNNLFFVLVYSSSQLIHLFINVYNSNLDTVLEGAIFSSMTALFIFSFLLMRSMFKNRNNLKKMNYSLESKVFEHTQDLESQTKELATKNKELEEFAYVVSHDLKRPLRNIYTLTDWLTEDKMKLDKEELENLKLIKEQLSQMDLLVEGILSYSLQVDKDQNYDKVDVQALVERIVMLNTNEKCQITLEGKLPEVEFNTSKLLQVFQNLIQNAIKHNDKPIVKINIGCQSMDNEYQFFIKDNGPGISSSYHKKVFQLFQRLDNKPDIDSVGIGLALVKKNIEQHGGVVWLESEEEKGATFFFTIPKS